MKRESLQLAAGLVFLLLGISHSNAADDATGSASSGSAPKPAITDWHSVESDDYLNYVKNLQAAGCPPPTIRTVVTADVVAAFAGKRGEVVAARYKNFKYWQANPAETEARAKLAAQRHETDEEMNRVLQQLLGADADLPDVSREWQKDEWNHELAFLPPDKLKATEVVLEKFAKVNQQMRELAGGFNLTEDTNELQRILARYDEEQSSLQQFLSPEEYKLVEMTTSWTAANLRHAMVRFEPNEQEFRIVFEAWQPHDENLARLHALHQPDPGHLEKAAYDKIKEQLSGPRYEQYRATWWK